MKELSIFEKRKQELEREKKDSEIRCKDEYCEAYEVHTCEGVNIIRAMYTQLSELQKEILALDTRYCDDWYPIDVAKDVVKKIAGRKE